MKIATFNTNGIRARLPVLLRWLQQERPDILCLQETKVQDKDFPKAPFEDMGYHCTYRGQKAYNGVAIFTREKPENVVFGFGDGDPQEEPRMITLTVLKLHVVNTYVPQGVSPESEKFEYKLSWLKRLEDYFFSSFNRDAHLLWVGDFNIAPEPRDVYDPKKFMGQVGFHPQENEALTHIRSWGFEDVLRKYNSDEGAFSFWDYRIPKAVERGLGWRIDHIWASKPLAEHSTKAWIDVDPRRWEKPSDHTFVVADFDIETMNP